MDALDQKATEYLSRATAAKKREEAAKKREEAAKKREEAAAQPPAPVDVPDRVLVARQLAQEVLDGKRGEPTQEELVNTLSGT